MERKLLN